MYYILDYKQSRWRHCINWSYSSLTILAVSNVQNTSQSTIFYLFYLLNIEGHKFPSHLLYIVPKCEFKFIFLRFCHTSVFNFIMCLYRRTFEHFVQYTLRCAKTSLSILHDFTYWFFYIELSFLMADQSSKANYAKILVSDSEWSIKWV